jgi:hypothetical protein
VEFLILSLLIVFATFAGTDCFLIQAKHQQASHLMQYYLDRTRIEGRLSLADENQLIADFQDAGLAVLEIDAPREASGDPRVLRNLADPLASQVWLKVTARPETQPLIFGKLVGVDPDPGFVIRVGGRALSERVAP